MPGTPDTVANADPAGRASEVARYGVVGLFNAGVYLALYSALVLLGVPYVVSSLIAFPVSVGVGYLLHEHWTFRRGRPTLRGLMAFGATQVSALVLGLTILVILVDVVGFDPITGQLLATPVTPLFTYLVSRAWVFGDRP